MRKFMLFAIALFCALVSFTSCGSDDDETTAPSYEDIVLQAGETFTINGGGTWQSDEPLIVSVEGAVVTAERVGTTRIYSGNASFKVTVSPKYNLYYDPCMQWGASQTAVKSYMSGYTLSNESTELLLYTGKKAADFYVYSFENNGLKASMVLVNAMTYGDELTDFLLERYVVAAVDADENSAVFINIDGNMAVYLAFEVMNSTLYAAVMYIEFSSSDAKSRSIEAIDIEHMTKLLPWGESVTTAETARLISKFKD